MADDQEWCLECGAARTVIVGPPDWRVPLLVIGVVVLLVVGGFAFLLSQLGSNAGKVTLLQHRTAQTSRSQAHGPSLAAWQPGDDGYTVVLLSAPSRQAADADATRIATQTKLAGVGVLDTSQHPQMIQQGVWDVFAGRYPSYALAQTAASQAAHAGQAGAKPALVQHPGGG